MKASTYFNKERGLSMRCLKQFFKWKTTYLGIIIALIFQVVFFTVWLTAYNGVLDRTDQLNVGIVNEDKEIGNDIVRMIKQQSPFTTVVLDDKKQALQKMNEEKTYHMIIYIPEAFSSDFFRGKVPGMEFFINQSGPAISKQLMESATISISEAVNEKAYKQMQGKLLTALPETIAHQTGHSEALVQITKQVIEEVEKESKRNYIQPDITKVNHVEGFKSSLIPLMVVLASFVGAMVMSQQLQFTEVQLRSTFTRWHLFLTRQGINMFVSFILSLITLGLMIALDVTMNSNMAAVWLFQSMLFFSFLTLSQLFVIAFGNSGMVFNIALTAIQLVSSGALVPKEMVSPFYDTIGNVLPATYGVNGYFSVIFGGGDVMNAFWKLLFVSGATLFITIGVISMFQIVRKGVSN